MDNTTYSPLGWKKNLTPWILGFLAFAGWVTAIVFGFLWDRSVHSPKPLPILPVSNSWMGKFRHAAVATDNGVCSEIGRTDGKCHAIDARETAPNFTQFHSHPTTGWKSIAVPGELMGYWEIYKRFASLPWNKLLSPGIKLARDGMFVSQPMAKILRHKYVHKFLINEPTMVEYFVDNQTKDVFEEGEKLKNPKLAATLQQLSESENPVDLFYRGSLAKTIVGEIQDRALNISATDLTTGVGTATQTYHKLIEVMKFVYGHWKYFGDSNDSILLQAVNNLMKCPQYARTIVQKISKQKTFPADYYDSKLRNSEGKIGPLDKGGTAQISIIDQWGNAVSVTSSINWLFGSMRRSPSTGIIWNNHLADFSADINSFNSMKPGKRPRSAMTPAIIFDSFNLSPKLAIGGAGGSKITATVGYVATRVLYLNETVKYATDAPRFYNRYTDTYRKYVIRAIKHKHTAGAVFKEYLKKLTTMGHKFTDMPMPSILQTVLSKDGYIFANTDYRKSSYPAGY